MIREPELGGETAEDRLRKRSQSPPSQSDDAAEVELARCCDIERAARSIFDRLPERTSGIVDVEDLQSRVETEYRGDRWLAEVATHWATVAQNRGQTEDGDGDLGSLRSKGTNVCFESSQRTLHRIRCTWRRRVRGEDGRHSRPCAVCSEIGSNNQILHRNAGQCAEQRLRLDSEVDHDSRLRLDHLRCESQAGRVVEQSEAESCGDLWGFLSARDEDLFHRSSLERPRCPGTISFMEGIIIEGQPDELTILADEISEDPRCSVVLIGMDDLGAMLITIWDPDTADEVEMGLRAVQEHVRRVELLDPRVSE